MKRKRYGLRLLPVLLIALLGFTSLAWGVWLLVAPAHPAGAYPQYGHATDFSWIAGEMVVHIPSWAQLPDAGCSIFRYGESSTEAPLSGQVVKLGGSVWEDYYASKKGRGDVFFVFFGHIAAESDQFICDRNVPGYIVERVQVNPAPYPLYGYAEDFSWVVGQITELGDLAGTCWGCDCAILAYGTQDARVQMDGSGWRTYWLNNHAASSAGLIGKHLVLFGHLAQPGEAARVCVRDRTAPVYIVDQVQENLTP
jgi:hypothetical protein